MVYISSMILRNTIDLLVDCERRNSSVRTKQAVAEFHSWLRRD